MSGADVTLLQQILAGDKKIYPEGLVTGYYGALTEKAVKQFQKKYNISQVGIVGPMTLGKLTQITLTYQNGSTTTIKIVSPGGIFSKNNSSDDDGDDDDKKNNRVQKLLSDHKVLICHKNTETESVDYHALIAHINHGDRVGACNGVPPVSTTTLSISLLGAAPIVDGATITWQTNLSSDSTVWYASSTPILDTVGALKVVNPSLVTNHSVSLTGLNPNETYFYKVVSRNSEGKTATSSVMSFTTSSTDTTAPIVYGVTANPAIGSANISWLTNEPTKSKIWYSTMVDIMSDPNRKSLEDLSLLTSHSLNLTPLSQNTLYRFLIVSTDAAGNVATSSSNLYAFSTGTFTLTAISATPAITTANVAWTTSSASDTKVYYATSTPVLTALSMQLVSDAGMVTNHSISLTGLVASTTYYYLAVSKDAFGNVATSTEQMFTTL